MVRTIFLGLLVLALAAGCGDDDVPSMDGGMDGGEPDAGPLPDGALVPDGAVRCSTDSECEDEVACTRDICDVAARYCRHPVDPAVCDDGVFCNGVEACDPLRGCLPAPMPETCNDDDVCTLDRCDEAERICRHEPRDFDGDGEADWHCEGGTDCDDRNPLRSSGVNEICGDDLDNDCDELVDEGSICPPAFCMGGLSCAPDMLGVSRCLDGMGAGECGRPIHDTCDDALDISAGGTFLLENGGAALDYSLTCGGFGRDLVLTFTLAELSSVDISVDGAMLAWAALRTTCDERSTELECTSGYPARLRARELAAGTYFLMIADSGTGTMQVDAEFGPPLAAPPNETCASPLDVSAGGSFPGSYVDVPDTYRLGCGTSRGADLVYTFTTTEPQDVRMTLIGERSETMALSVRSACDDDTTALRCASGGPVGTTLHELPAGTYFVIAEGPSGREVDFDLDVSFLPPTPTPPGDTCADPIPLALGRNTLGTLADKEDDHDISCGFNYRDAVYSFTIPDRSDVTIVVDGGGTFMRAAVRASCDDMATRLRCVTGLPARARLRDLPAGTYYVIAEAFRGSGFNIQVDATPPTPVTMVSGNESCGTAHTVPAAGGVFAGDTTSMLNDYETSTCGSMARANDAAFVVDLPTSRHVIASTEGSDFDTVLHAHQGMCVSAGERYCDDDGGTARTSVIDRTFDAGTWYFIVDGRGSSAGNYVFELMFP